MESSNDLWGPDWPDVRARWDLDPTLSHLNHGSFGAVPRTVRAAQRTWRELSDVNPMRFYHVHRAPAIIAARQAAAAFLGTSPDALALVANATAGVSTVLAALPLRPGDEIVLTDHTYGAVGLAARRFATAAGAEVVTVNVGLTAPDDEVVRQVDQALSPRTRLVLIDQVTSPTARTFPLREIAELARSQGVAVLVDGAHAPGMLDLDVESLGVDFWVGNFHKWAFAARSVAALWVAPSWRDRIRPLVVSWNEEEPFPGPFDQQGTVDDSAWLALPEAVRFFDSLGAERLRHHNSALAAYAQSTVASALRVSLADVIDNPTLSMRLVPLPARAAELEKGGGSLYQRVATELRAEVALVTWLGRRWLRLSAQAYNTPAEYDRLGAGLATLLR